jgi:HAMP domain-containing protein
MYAKSLDIPVNTLWGAVMLVFGLAMLYFAKRGNKA